MKRLFFALTVSLLVFSGCSLGVSKYNDAVLDGISHLNTGKPEKALEDFNRAIKIDPTRADGYLGRANSLNTLGKYSKALEDYHRVIEIEPDLGNAYINRAIAYSQLGQYKKAIADYEKGLELDPKIDNKPSFFKRLFSNDPNIEKGIRKHLEFLRQKVKDQS
jgi:tetratricopeptide (TPR) repeat protein